ncbi:MAG: hypothetical protein ABIS08_00725 [Pseudolysinimonas sp.]
MALSSYHCYRYPCCRKLGGDISEDAVTRRDHDRAEALRDVLAAQNVDERVVRAVDSAAHHHPSTGMPRPGREQAGRPNPHYDLLVIKKIDGRGHFFAGADRTLHVVHGPSVDVLDVHRYVTTEHCALLERERIRVT